MDPIIKIPEIVAPAFWLSSLDRVGEYLMKRLQRGRLVEFGQSALGRPLHAVEYNVAASPALVVMGGTHGHEPGTVAAAMNLIHLLETGRDLDGRPHGRLCELLRRVRLLVIPVFNPDGRAVCPDTFYNLGIEPVSIYSCGLRKDGKLIPYDADSEEPLYAFDPEQALFVGGQFNGAGHAINRVPSRDNVTAVEVRHLIEFLGVRQYDGLLDMHACGYNFAFQVRSHEAPYWPVMREWQRRAEPLFGAEGYPLELLQGDGDPPEPPGFLFNSGVVHPACQLMWIAFEGRQGYPTKQFWPITTEWEIIDAYLEAISVFVELGVEGFYARANQAAFG